MRNPIFAADTLFSTETIAGYNQRVADMQSIALSDGTRLIALEAEQYLVEVRTASGIVLHLSPESAFALAKNSEGHPQRWHPVPVPSEHNLSLICPEKFPGVSSDAYLMTRCYMAGILVGNGRHSMAHSRASSATVPQAVAVEIEDMVLNWADEMVELRLLHAYATGHSVVDLTGGDYFIRSRLMSLLADGLVTEKVQQITFALQTLLEANPALMWAFMRGLISSLSLDKDQGLTFSNRDRRVVEWVADKLWHHFGVPTTLLVDYDEPEVHLMRNAALPHRFRLSSDWIGYTIAAGLREGRFDSHYTVRPLADPIRSIAPMTEKVRAVLVAGGEDRITPMTANGLIFSSEFSMPSGIEAVASHPTLVNDPAYF